MSTFAPPQFVNQNEISTKTDILDFIETNSELGFDQSLRVLDKSVAWIEVREPRERAVGRRPNSVCYQVNLDAARTIIAFRCMGFDWRKTVSPSSGEFEWVVVAGETLTLRIN